MKIARAFPIELLEAPARADPVPGSFWFGICNALPISLALWAMIFWALGLL